MVLLVYPLALIRIGAIFIGKKSMVFVTSQKQRRQVKLQLL